VKEQCNEDISKSICCNEIYHINDEQFINSERKSMYKAIQMMTVELQQLCTTVIHPKFVRSRMRMNMKNLSS